MAARISRILRVPLRGGKIPENAIRRGNTHAEKTFLARMDTRSGPGSLLLRVDWSRGRGRGLFQGSGGEGFRESHFPFLRGVGILRANR